MTEKYIKKCEEVSQGYNFEINFALNMGICNYSAIEPEPKSDLESVRKNAIFGHFIWSKNSNFAPNSFQ